MAWNLKSRRFRKVVCQDSFMYLPLCLKPIFVLPPQSCLCSTCRKPKTQLETREVRASYSNQRTKKTHQKEVYIDFLENIEKLIYHHC